MGNSSVDALRGAIGTRTYLIHSVLLLASDALSAKEVGRRAEMLARLAGCPVEPGAFSGPATGSHLHTMQGRGFAERTSGGDWQLTQQAHERLAMRSRTGGAPALAP
jgi:hypothetical protein